MYACFFLRGAISACKVRTTIVAVIRFVVAQRLMLQQLTMETVSATSALGPVQAASGASGMEELLPLVLQLTNAEQVRHAN